MVHGPINIRLDTLGLPALVSDVNSSLKYSYIIIITNSVLYLLSD
jgi:hypothetical protein